MAGYCTNCGARLADGIAFCTKCGAPVEGVDRPAPVSTDGVPQRSYYASSSTRPSESRTGLIVGICVVVAVIVIAAAAFFFVIPNMTSSNVSKSSSVSAPAASPSSSNAGASAQFEAPAFTSVQVSSQLPGDSDTADYGAVNLTDGNSETAWNEGATGDGAGEWIKFTAGTPQRVTSVSIMGGFPRTYKDGSDVYFKNNRPKQITISYNGGSEKFTMQDLRGQFQTFTLAKPVETTQITITIDSVYKGTKYDECCIAEVRIQ